MASDDPILGVVVRDCAAKLVIRYHFADPITRARVDRLGDFTAADVQVHEFSRFVASARDAFKVIGTGEAVLAQGVVGDPVLRVTFGWLSTRREADRALAERFDAFLVDQGWGARVVRDERYAVRDGGAG